ncbi:MAG: hypothetical protein ABL908_03500 [Hyphomicrobium sp.]
MTTVDTAAAWQSKKPVALAAILIFTATGLAGCETGANLLGPSTPTTNVAEQLAPSTPASRKLATVAIAPVIGAPDNVAKQLQAQLTSAAERQNIGFVKGPGDKLDYTLRGYVVSAREKAGIKVSYIWDVTDPSGRRVNRIAGEETVTGAESKDPWVQVSPQVTQSIADKTAQSLATWLPTQSGAAAGVPVAAAQSTAPGALGGPSAPPAAAPALASASTGPSGSPTTGSIAPSGSVTASIPSVVGAPGDGGTALTSAIQRELTRGGVALAGNSAAASAYKVEGRVKLGESRDGKQPITIDWDVKDPKGKKLGTVSQKNEIPQGSLDGSWGKTADAAAAAAAQGILKLLPAQKSTN